ncbi:MAG TPA: DUF1697 domain-containing protein [Acidimicrobiia bacterium]|nr:DUF1697 domain-containing protein [Acidimicrobiia bacterium]
MKTYVALLRAVNVSGQNKLSMAELRTHLARRGYQDVATYVQSGNVVLAAPATPEPKLVAELEREIRQAFDLTVTVLVRTPQQLRAIRSADPFARRGAETQSLYVTFLATRPTPTQVKGLAAQGGGPDEAVVRGREVHLHCPGGYGRTKLNNAFIERQLATKATTRNWNTLTKLLDLAGG